eukprot:352753-Chlamydomonas_euryale.AAC.2
MRLAAAGCAMPLWPVTSVREQRHLAKALGAPCPYGPSPLRASSAAWRRAWVHHAPLTDQPCARAAPLGAPDTGLPARVGDRDRASRDRAFVRRVWRQQDLHTR